MYLHSLEAGPTLVDMVTTGFGNQIPSSPYQQGLGLVRGYVFTLLHWRSHWTRAATAHWGPEVFNRATTITTDEARLDIEARGFWECRQECTMFDVRVFNPCADSYRHAPLSTLYRRQERLKRNAYEERVRQVEKASFVPLVSFTTSGSASPVATVVLKRLAARLAEARDQSYSTVMGWQRCRLSFCLLRCAVMCFRGSRSRRTTALDNVPNLACSAARVHFAAWVCLFHFVRSTSCLVCLPSFVLSLRLVPLYCFVIFFIYCLLFVSLFTLRQLQPKHCRIY